MSERQELTLRGDYFYTNIPEAPLIEQDMLEKLGEPAISVGDYLQAVEAMKSYNVRVQMPLQWIEAPTNWVLSFSHYPSETKGLWRLLIGTNQFIAWNPITCILRGKEWFLKNGGSK